MLEGRQCLFRRALPSSCEQEILWLCMNRHLGDVRNGKRSLDEEVHENEDRRKFLKSSGSVNGGEDVNLFVNDSNGGNAHVDGCDMNCHLGKVSIGKLSLDKEVPEESDKNEDWRKSVGSFSLVNGGEEVALFDNDINGGSSRGDGYDMSCHLGKGPNCKPSLDEEVHDALDENEDQRISRRISSSVNGGEEVAPFANDSTGGSGGGDGYNDSNGGSGGGNGCNNSNGGSGSDDGYNDSNGGSGSGNGFNNSNEGSGGGDGYTDSNGGSGGGDAYDTNSLIHTLGRDNSINCLLQCSRSAYGSLASLNRGFRSLIRSGELYRHRRQLGIVEHWVYFSCILSEWDAFDPYHRRWMRLPRMPPGPDECFLLLDKESLAVGTQLLVFGKGATSPIVMKYSILTNSWSPGVQMISPRCLFGSASLGHIAIVAGGFGPQGICSTAELYDSEGQTWTTLPCMNTPRRMCSGFFMDRKFYVIGGMRGMTNDERLTCGEEFDLETQTWRVIPNMSPAVNGPMGAPPLVAVVNNQLYAVDYAERELMKYDKNNNSWANLGSLPERSVSFNGWGVAFRACGERLIVIGGPRAQAGGSIEVNSWIPNDGPPEWELIARKPYESFVFNCAVMGC